MSSTLSTVAQRTRGPEEPDAVIPHVRICGGPGRAISLVYPTDSMADDLTCGLVRLGIPVARSRQLIHEAMEAISPTDATEATLLQRALVSL